MKMTRKETIDEAAKMSQFAVELGDIEMVLFWHDMCHLLEGETKCGRRDCMPLVAALAVLKYGIEQSEKVKEISDNHLDLIRTIVFYLETPAAVAIQ